MRSNTPTQIVVVDAGGQYCHLITRRVRETGVLAKVSPPEKVIEEVKRTAARGVIISGGPSSVYEANAPRIPPELFRLGIPVLGICYGHQLMAHALGGKVRAGRKHEYGESSLELLANDTILKGLQKRELVWMSHGDEVISPPAGFQILARTPSCPVAAMWSEKERLFGLQFHPEVSHTPHGKQILANFIFDVCRCHQDWSLEGIVPKFTEEIRANAGERNVLFFVSGGVDSTVAFALCSQALSPERVIGVFIDTGFMRKGERKEIEDAFDRKGWHNVRFLERSDLFLKKLRDVTDPEEKRHRIGEAFLAVQSEVEAELGLSSRQWMLGQGTIYPDTIESGGTALAQVIKTHHNRVPAIEKLLEEGLVLEPLREFYKDEVRAIGRQLDLPADLVSKHPFPGPGLAVRCLCSRQEVGLEKSRELTDFAARFDLDAWMVPLRTVGVQGDHRSYTNLVILTGNASLGTFGEAARVITREIRHTNRVVFLVEPNDAGVLRRAKVREAYVDRGRLQILREADAAASEMLKHADLYDEVWQFPVVSLPLTLGLGDAIALRPVSSTDAMTARYADLPMEFIKGLGRRLVEISGIDLVLYDITDKPPATIEWE